MNVLELRLPCLDTTPTQVFAQLLSGQNVAGQPSRVLNRLERLGRKAGPPEMDDELDRLEQSRFEQARLVKQAKAGDLGAFEQLYRNHVGHVFGLCMRMVADPGRAEELTQDAFVRAWQKLQTFRGDSLFSSWLHRLTVNLVLSDRRKRSRREDREEEIDDSIATPQSAKGSSGIELERAIANLPPRAREVFVLFEVYGYRHHEVAELLGISTGGCKSQLSRARKLMRKSLEEGPNRS